MRSHLWNHLLCFISMEKQIIFFWIAGFFLPAINATVFTNILVVPMSRMYHLSIWNLFIINFTLKTTFRKPQNSFRHDWLSTRNYFWNNADSKYLAQSYSMIALIDVGGSSEFMGKTFQAAQLTHERFLTVDHSCKIFSLISAKPWTTACGSWLNWTSRDLWCVVLYVTLFEKYMSKSSVFIY